MTPTTQNKTQQSLYSNMAASATVPKKDQAIVFDTVEGVRIDEYIYAIGDKIEPENIISASKITQNRFCMYLTSAKLVDDITQEGNNELTFNGTTVTIRPYVARLKRIIISNLHACVPNYAIMNKLSEYNVEPKSSITPLRVGLDRPRYTHIICHRRQLFVEPDDVNKIPSEFTLSHDGTSYHIFVTTDKMVCFQCRNEGHTSKHCPQNKEHNITTISQNPNSTQQINLLEANDGKEESDKQMVPGVGNTGATAVAGEPSADSTPPASASTVSTEHQPHQFNGQTLFVPPTPVNNNNKRALSISSTSTEKIHTIKESKQDPNKNKNKSENATPPTKKKKITTTEIQAEIDAAKIEISELKIQTFPITFEKLTEFITDMLDVKLTDVSEHVENTQRTVMA